MTQPESIFPDGQSKTEIRLRAFGYYPTSPGNVAITLVPENPLADGPTITIGDIPESDAESFLAKRLATIILTLG